MSKVTRIEALLLALFAFFVFCFGPLCENAEAVVVVDDAILAVIIAALAAMGIVFTTTGAFNSLKEYVDGLIQQYASSQNTTVNGLLSGVQVGSNGMGKLLLNNRFVIFLDGFVAWLKYEFSLTNNSSVVLQSENVYLGNCFAYPMPVYFRYDSPGSYYVQQTWTYIEALSDDCVILCTESGRFIVVSRDIAAPVRVTRVGVNRYGATEQISDDTYFTGKESYNLNGYIIENPENSYVIVNSGSGTPSYIEGGYSFVTNTDGDVVSAIMGGALTNNVGIGIDAGVITKPSEDAGYGDGDGAILDVDADWGDSLPEIINTIPNTFEDSEIEYESNDVVEEQVEETLSEQISGNASDYQVIGLQNVFPFCIPFDIYAFFECLAADPVAPVISWRFYVPGICDETITIDLAQYNNVAQVLRTMELLAFIIGLAFVTREKFLRG